MCPYIPNSFAHQRPCHWGYEGNRINRRVRVVLSYDTIFCTRPPSEFLILRYPEFLHPREFSERLAGIGSRLPIQNDRNSRNKLVQEVEVADIPCQHAGTDTPRLKVDERIVEVFALMTRTLRRAAETKELARKHSRFAPHRRIRSLQAMPRNVFNHIPYRLQNPTR